MKARIKATGEIVNVYNWGEPTLRADNGDIYQKSELDFDVEDENNPDYWTRLEHTYAGEFMRSFLDNFDGTVSMAQLTDDAIDLAHAFVEKLKEKEERK